MPRAAAAYRAMLPWAARKPPAAPWAERSACRMAPAMPRVEAAATQWRVAPMGGLLGLDYAAARAAALGLGVEWGRVFGGVRIMEAAVLDARGPA